MAQFSIQPDNVLRLSDDEKKYIDKLNQIESTIREVKNSLRWKIAAQANISASLNAVDRHAVNCATSMHNMQRGLEDAVSKYKETEQKLVGNGFENQWKEDTIWNIVDGAGVIGQGAKLVKDFFSNSFVGEAKDWISWGKDLWDEGWKIADTAKEIQNDSNAKWWKQILDLDTSTVKEVVKDSADDWKKLLKNAKESVIDDFVGDLSTTVGKVKKAGEGIFSVAVNAFDNFEEYKRGEIGRARAVAETVTETIVDWGKDIAIGTVVLAGAAAFTAASGIAVPAVAVTAATVVVSVGADKLCEWATGKGVTEFTSDLLLDGIGWGAKKVKEGASVVWRKIEESAKPSTTQDLNLVLA